MSNIRIFRFDASSCNGCDIEVLGMLALGLPLDELGIKIVFTPEEANTLVVTGGVNVKSEPELKRIYELIEPPRLVIAIGSCGATEGVFKGGYTMTGPVDKIIPVNLYIMGCPPRPQVIATALVDALNLEAEGAEALLKTPEGFRGEPAVDPSKCMGCAACVVSCPAGAIVMDDAGGKRTVKFTHKDCIYCATCQEVCPTEAVVLAYRDKTWFTDKDTAISEADLELKNCRRCGQPFVTAKQADWAIEKVESKLSIPPAIQDRLVENNSLCPACRQKNISEIREAKQILVSLANRS